MKLRQAYFKYTKKHLNFVLAYYTKLYNWNTPPYSHVEVGVEVKGFIKKDKLILSESCEKQWFYFSSTLRDGAKGTRWIEADEMLKHRERWDIYEEKEEYADFDGLIKRANYITPAGYDFPGLFGFTSFFLGRIMNSFKSWYCSEACWYVRHKVWKKVVSPRRMWRLQKDGLVLVDIC